MSLSPTTSMSIIGPIILWLERNQPVTNLKTFAPPRYALLLIY